MIWNKSGSLITEINLEWFPPTFRQKVKPEESFELVYPDHGRHSECAKGLTVNDVVA